LQGREPPRDIFILKQVFPFENLHDNYYINASGRDLFAAFFFAKFLIQRYVFPG